jgi:hypothetical protein
MNIFSILILPALLHVVYTDMKNYQVHLISLLTVALLASIRFASTVQTPELWVTILLNVVFVSILLGTLLVYSLIKRKKLTEQFAWGDILFLLVAVLCFSPINFMGFIIVSSITGILYYLISHNTKKNQINTLCGSHGQYNYNKPKHRPA